MGRGGMIMVMSMFYVISQRNVFKQLGIIYMWQSLPDKMEELK
jgi:hypothetical protein